MGDGTDQDPQRADALPIPVVGTGGTEWETTVKHIRKITVAVVIAAAALFGVAGGAQPASAATAVSSCFKWDTGTAYKSQPVFLMKWNGSAWTSIRSGRTNASGCGTFTNVPSNVYVTMQAYSVLGDGNIGLAIYSSNNGIWATPGSGGVSLGTQSVRLVQCTRGLYGYCAGLR